MNTAVEVLPAPSDWEVMDRKDSTASRLFGAGVLACAIGVMLAVAAENSTVSWVAVAVFAALLVLADRTEVELPGGENISASFMLLLAAVVVFRVNDQPLGPMLVAAASDALYLRHWQERRWAKLAFNFGTFVLCAACATGIAFVFPVAAFSQPLMLATIGILGTAAAWAINIALLATSHYLADERKPLDLIVDVRPFVVSAVPFAILGAFIGRLYLDFGPLMMPLLIAPIIVARQVFATSLRLKETQDSAVSTLIRALEAKDRYTAGHVERVAVYSVYIGEQLGLGPNRIERLRLAALMHDIGKLIVPNHLLNKPGRLTAEEFEQVKRHEGVSIELLSSIDFLAPVAPSASSEFTDYKPTDPRHPIEPYVVHVADAYDAMTSTRSYRQSLGQEVAFEELRQKAGTQFHPVVVEALIAAIAERGEIHGAEHETDAGDWLVPPPIAGTGSAGLGDLEPPQEASP